MTSAISERNKTMNKIIIMLAVAGAILVGGADAAFARELKQGLKDGPKNGLVQGLKDGAKNGLKDGAKYGPKNGRKTGEKKATNGKRGAE